MANQDQAYKGQTYIQTAELIKYPTPTTPVRPPVLIQQITDFHLSQEAWNKISSKMTEMEETNKLLKKEIKKTYKKVNTIPNPPPKKASNTTKTLRKVDKFADKSNKGNKDSNKTSKNF